MKVRELVELLQKCNQELDVYCYNGLDEGGGNVWDAKETTKKFPYCKGDPPDSLNDGDAYVLINVE